MTSQTDRPALGDPGAVPPPQPDRAAARRMLLAPTLLGLFLVLAFAGLTIPALQNPTPKDLPVGVVGPPEAGRQLSAQLGRENADAFDVETYASADRAREAILEQEILGAFVLEPGRPPSLLLAGAAGDAPTRALETAYEKVTEALGATGTVENVAPLPEEDARGISGFLLCVALVIGALLFQAVLSLMAARLPARARFLVGAGYAVIAGLVGAVLAGPVIGALTGNFLQLAGIAVLLSLAVVGIVAACQSLLGVLGVAVGALIVLPLGVSSSGGPVEYHFLPEFYSTISQYLPMGATVTLLRRVFYFDGNSVAAPLLALAGWTVAAWLIALVMERIRPYRPAVLVLPVGRAG